tara:strand:- start:93 stop:497 length:405 start_codon:yes stop_codon:yes gene_type:complete
MEEESNEYKKITKENQYDFMFWCMDLKPPSIDGETFSLLLKSNINYLIEKNCVWQYGYTYTFDMFMTQNNVRKDILEEEERKIEIIKLEKERKRLEKLKPISREERAKLFAEAASKRILPQNKKIKKAWVKKAW